MALRLDYRALLLAVDDIPPGPSDDASEGLLQQAEAAAKERLSKTAFGAFRNISAWREAYKAFESKPAKYRNSAEPLIRRAEASLPRVNRSTDIDNAISVKYCIALGGEDLDKYTGAPFCARATGKEDFSVEAGGETTVEHPDAGGVVWCDDAGVACRRWNWRQGLRTALACSS